MNDPGTPHSPPSAQPPGAQPWPPQTAGYPPPGYAQPVDQPYGSPGQYPPVNFPQAKPMSGKAIAALVLGIVSVMMWPLAVITGPLALVFGWMAMSPTKSDGPERGRALAVIGMVIGVVMFFGALAIGAIMVFAFSKVEEIESRRQERSTLEMSDVDQDLRLIAERLNLYCQEHGSLEPGGMEVCDGEESLQNANRLKVTGSLRLQNLVRLFELKNSYMEYELIITDTYTARVVNSKAGRTLELPDARKKSFTISNHTGGGK